MKKNTKAMNRDHNMQKDHEKATSKVMYRKLFMMIATMFIIMHFIMYAMIDSTQDFFLNLNNIYMTLLMTTAMIIIEVLIMKEMYANKKWNGIILVASLAFMIFSWFGIREQIGIGDKEFIKGMIPHHSAALLMSRQSKITDPELLRLRDSILSAQQREIDFMKLKLKELQEK